MAVCVDTNRLAVLGLSATVLTLVVALFFGFTVAVLGAVVVLSSDFLVLVTFLVVVKFG